MKRLPKKKSSLTIHKTISTIRDFENKDLKKLIKKKFREVDDFTSETGEQEIENTIINTMIKEISLLMTMVVPYNMKLKNLMKSNQKFMAF